MNLLLCSKNETVLEKWSSALSGKWQLQQAMSFNEIKSFLDQFEVDLLLLHRNMLDSAQLTSLCRETKNVHRVFVFSDRPDDSEGMTCLKMGCVGYANTYIRQERLVSAIESVSSGLVWVGESLMRYLIKGLAATVPQEDVANDGGISPQLDSLSKREYQIARLVADGLANSEIAEELDIAERTVKAHLSSIYSKTKTKGRLNLALLINS